MGYLFSWARLSKSATESCLDAAEITILLAGLILAYGAIGEYLEEHGRLPRWMTWSKRPRLVFVWMVALSLVGEFAGDAGVFVFSRRLQSISDIEVAALGKQAGQANERAKVLEAQVKGYDKQIADDKVLVASSDAASREAVADVSKASARIAEAQKDAAESRKETAQFNETAEREMLARINLEKQVTWRTLNDGDCTVLANQMRPFAKSMSGRKVNVGSYLGDPEGAIFAAGIIAILKRAGIDFEPHIGMNMASGGLRFGVYATAPTADGPFIDSLISGVHSRVDTFLEAESGPKYTEVRILIGVKPVAGLPEPLKDFAPPNPTPKQ